MENGSVTYLVLLFPHWAITQSHSISPLLASRLCSANRLSLSVSSSDQVPCCPPGATLPVAALNVDNVPDGGGAVVAAAAAAAAAVAVVAGGGAETEADAVGAETGAWTGIGACCGGG